MFLLSCIALILVTASCVRRDQSKETAPSADLLTYPNECQGQMPNREDISIGSQLAAVRCSCVVGQTMYSWFNSVVDRDPSSYCGIYPNQAVLPEPVQYSGVSGYTFETNTYQSQGTTTNTAPANAPPPLPTVVPFAPPSVTVAPPVVPPVPSATAQPAKKEPGKFAPYVREQSVKYECKEGLKAERTYVLILSEGQKHSEQTIKQVCAGQTVGCLKGADAKNYMIPPCSCAVGEEVKLINSQGLWTCNPHK